MSKAATNRVGLYYKLETLWGEAPVAAAFKQLRYTGETLSRDKATAESAIIRSDRMYDDLAVLGFSCAGDVNIEMAYSIWDDYIQALLGGTWATATSAGLTLTVAAGAHTISRSAGSWIVDGFVIGSYVKFSGFTTPANNGFFLISAVTALVLTVVDAGALLVNETSGAAACSAIFDYALNGVVERSFVLEKQFQDIGKFQWFNGLRVSQMDLDITAQQIIKGKFAFMGKDSQASAATVTGSLVPAAVTPIMSASANVGALSYKGAALATGIKSIKFTIADELRKQDIVAQAATGGIEYGAIKITGVIEAYFEDLTLLNDIISHATVSLSIPITDASGNSMGFNFPAIKLIKGTPNAAAINQDVMLPIDFEAIRDPVTNAAVIVSKSS